MSGRTYAEANLPPWILAVPTLNCVSDGGGLVLFLVQEVFKYILTFLRTELSFKPIPHSLIATGLCKSSLTPPGLTLLTS